MIKSKNRLIIAGVILLVGGWGINKWLKSMPKAINSDAYAGLDLNMVLSKGSNGSEVAELQRILVNDKSLAGLLNDKRELYNWLIDKTFDEQEDLKEINMYLHPHFDRIIFTW